MSGYTGSADSTRPANINATAADHNSLGLVYLGEPNTVAPAGTAVNGSDLRLGMPGGVSVSPSNAQSASASGAFDWAGDWHFSTVMRISARTAGHALINAETGGLSVGFNGGNLCVRKAGVSWNGAFAAGSVVPVGEWFSLSLENVSGTITAHINGVAVGMAPSPSLVSAPAFGLGYAVAGLEVHSAYLFNRALTESERLQVMRGEAPTSLANRADGVSYTQGESQTFTNNVGGWLAYGEGLGAAIAATGGKLVCTGASEIGWCNQFYNGGVPFPAGEYAATFKARSVSGTVAGLLLTTPYDGAASTGATSVAITGTEATYTLRVTLTAAAYLGINPAGGSSAGCVYELDDVVIVRLGTVARYEPQNVTSLGRWIDSSGNANDLIPGKGVTPLNPQPVQVRSEAFVYHDAESRMMDEGTHLWAFSRQTVGTVIFYAPTWLPAASRKSASVVFGASIPGGQPCFTAGWSIDDGATLTASSYAPATVSLIDSVKRGTINWTE